jgi:hypothetical protein
MTPNGVLSQSAREGFTAFADMAGDAVAGRHQILAAANLRCIGRGIIETLREQPAWGDGRTWVGRQGQHLAHRETGHAQDRDGATCQQSYSQ